VGGGSALPQREIGELRKGGVRETNSWHRYGQAGQKRGGLGLGFEIRKTGESKTAPSVKRKEKMKRGRGASNVMGGGCTWKLITILGWQIRVEGQNRRRKRKDLGDWRRARSKAPWKPGSGLGVGERDAPEIRKEGTEGGKSRAIGCRIKTPVERKRWRRPSIIDVKK